MYNIFLFRNINFRKYTFVLISYEIHIKRVKLFIQSPLNLQNIGPTTISNF